MMIRVLAGTIALSLWTCGASMAAGQDGSHFLRDGLRQVPPLDPGGIVRLTVRPSRPLASLDGDALGRALRFWPVVDADVWHALLGAGLETAPGSYEVTIRATAIDGDSAVHRVPVVVEPRQYETRSIRVADRFINPPAAERARIAQERQLLELVLAQVHPERLWRGPFALPVSGTTTRGFGRLTILNGRAQGRHQGADFRAAGGTPILAPNAGRVVLAADLYLSGNTVVLDHGHGLFSVFAHLSEVAVEVGSPALKGDLLGRTGATGRVTGPHLHWAVRLGGTSVDPHALIDAVADLNETTVEP
jgi:murein DD-endopeptidase MepM/ murein hydrolase activator NlpD